MGTSVTIAVIVALALLVSWLGGGRKWAFRTMLPLLILAFLTACGVFGYVYWTEKTAERRAQKLHECAVAKIATARCEQPPSSKAKPEHGPWEKYQNKADVSKEVVWDICPPYELPDNPTPEQENAALTAAEQACKAEMVPQRRPCTSRSASIGGSTASSKRPPLLSHKATSSINWSANVLRKLCSS